MQVCVTLKKQNVQIIAFKKFKWDNHADFKNSKVKFENIGK